MNNDIDLNSAIQSISQHEMFYSRLCQFLLMVKLAYGGSGVRAYFVRHKNIQKYLMKKLHQESLDIDELFATLNLVSE